MKQNLLLSTLVGYIFISSFYSHANAQTYQNISVTEAQTLIQQNEHNAIFTILDVRTSGEYNSSHLNGAFQRDFYASDFSQQLDVLNKERIYLIYCQSGNRSGQAFQIMQNLGFDHVYNMLGGISSWISNGLPVTDLLPPSLDLTLDFPVAHIINSVDNIEILPKPSSDAITIDGDFSQYSIKIINENGQLVRDYDFVLQPLVIDLNALSSMQHFISIQSTMHSALSVQTNIK